MRLIVTVVVILGVFGLFLLLMGKDPIKAYRDTFTANLCNPRGLSELVVRIAPLLLTALAVAIPFRVGLINVGAEGQFMLGALLGSWAALNVQSLPQPLHLLLLVLAGMAGGAL